MVTVLFVAAVLTVVASTAAFTAMRELQASGADRSAAQALSFAEAGIDRFVLELRRGTFSWQQLNTAGCNGNPYLSLPPGSLGAAAGQGSYLTELVVYDPDAAAPSDRLPPAACIGRPEKGEPGHFALLSSGASASVGRRMIRQVITIEMMPIPVGLFVESVDANGNTQVRNTSLVATGDIVGRDKIGFSGTDPYYTLADFYGPTDSDTTNIPAAAHAVGAIYTGKTLEHPPSPNCNANPRGTMGQSLWDGSAFGGPVTSGCAGQVGAPPTARFTGLPGPPGLSQEEYAILKETAKASGLYCNFAGTPFCTSAGTVRGVTTNVQASDLTGLPNSFVAYFDFAAGSDPFSNLITWKASVGPCSDTPAINRSAVVVVRNGSIKMNGVNAAITGGVFAPEGVFDSAGSFNIHGTLIAKQLRLRGSGVLEMSECWLRNIPSPLLDVELARWSELDR